MTGTALAKASPKSTAVSFKYDAKKFDTAVLNARLNSIAKAMGGNELGEGGNFFKPPGEKITFKKGVWYTGTKKADKKTLEADTLAVEFHQISMVWCKWVEKNDKRVPEFVGLTQLLEGVEFPDRETLGDLDESEWEIGMNGKPDDPWKSIMFIPVRDVDGETIDHIELSSKSASREGLYLFRKLAAELSTHVGELPIVRLDASVYEVELPAVDSKGNPIIDKKTGKQKTTKLPVDKPKFEIVGWTPMKECDNPDNSAAEVSDDVGEVEAVARGGKKEEAAAPAPAKAKPAKRAVKAVEEDDDSI